MGGFFYFAATDGGLGSNGRELWRTDGTEAGTTLVKNIRPGAADSNPSGFVLAGNRIYFTADDGVHGRELWKTDGTAQGTTMVLDFTPGPAPTPFGEMKPSGTALCFAVDTNPSTREFGLFRTDGTALGTFSLAGVGGASTTNPAVCFDTSGIEVMIGTLDFPDIPGKPTTNSIWRFTGTGPFAAIRLAAVPNPITSVQLLGTNCYFVSHTNRCIINDFLGTTNCFPTTRLSRVNAIGGGTPQLLDTNQFLPFSCGEFCSYPSSTEFIGMTVHNGRLFYFDQGIEGVFQQTLHFQGMRAVANGALPVTVEPPVGSGLSFPQIIGSLGGRTHYLANNRIRRTDGLGVGTTVLDFGNGFEAIDPVQVGSRFFFFAFPLDFRLGLQLGVTDLTTPGTRLFSVGTNQPNGIRDILGALDANTLLFQAHETATGAELYRSDGTTEGTSLLKDIAVGVDSPAPSEVVVMGSSVFFSMESAGEGRELWKSDGTVNGMTLVADLRPGPAGSNPTNLTALGGVLYFAADDGANGSELWRSDGTAAGTFLVRDIRVGPSSSQISQLTAVSNKLFFVADDGAHGAELWMTDGTAAGTQLLQDVVPGIDPGEIGSLSGAGGRLYFLARTGSKGRELWTSDGQPGGTQFLKELTPGSTGSSLSPVVPLNGIHFFLGGNEGSAQGNLWKTDGTPEGTFLVRSGNHTQLATVGGHLVFNQGASVFRSDGTLAGTLLLANLPQAPDRFVSAGPLLFIQESARIHRTDGTPAGTRLAAEFPPSDQFDRTTFPSLLTTHRGTLVFVAGQPSFGRELWSLVPGQTPTMIEDLDPGSADPDIRAVVSLEDRIEYVVRPHGQPSWQVRKLTLQQLDPPARGPFAAASSRAPGRLEAENFDVGGEGRAYHDLTPANDGGLFRKAEAVDVEESTDLDGAFAVGFTRAGEWMEYTFETTQAGRYRLDTRVAAAAAGGAFHFDLDGVALGNTLVVPATGTGWATVTGPEILMNTGTHVLRLGVDVENAFGTAGSFNWLQWVLTQSNTPPSVEITSPDHGQIFATTAVLAVKVSDDTTASALVSEFLVDDVPVGGGPGVIQINWPVTPGAHVLRVRVTDSFGISQTSQGRLFFGADPVIPLGDRWKFFALGLLPATNWFDVDLDETRWNSGRAQFGFGDGDEVTALPVVNKAGARVLTYYFRHSFVVTNPPSYAEASLLRDDGAVVYLNGREIWRANLPRRGVPIEYDTFALTNLNNVTGNRQEEATDVFTIPSQRFLQGTNVIAVEMHQSTVTNAAQYDLSFDLSFSMAAFDPGVALRLGLDGSQTSLEWPDHLVDWVLEETSDLFTWSAVQGPIEIRNRLFRFAITPAGRAFYRLRLVAP